MIALQSTDIKSVETIILSKIGEKNGPFLPNRDKFGNYLANFLTARLFF